MKGSQRGVAGCSQTCLVRNIRGLIQARALSQMSDREQVRVRVRQSTKRRTPDRPELVAPRRTFRPGSARQFDPLADTQKLANPLQIQPFNSTPPVPEPASMGLFALGLLAIAAHHFRRPGGAKASG